MPPFYQGKIDTFCAVYAVLNALQITHDITAGKARELFNEVLIELSHQESRLRAVLAHRTDYVDLVDDMLKMVRRQFSLTEGPRLSPGASAAEVWNALEGYAMPARRRTAVFRFCRYLPGRATPVADHWTTAGRMEGNVLHFFDCSLEPRGAYRLDRALLVDHVADWPHEAFLIAPESVRLLIRA